MFKFDGQSSAEKYNEYLGEKWFILNQCDIYKILLAHLLTILMLSIMLNFDYFNSEASLTKVVLFLFSIPWFFAFSIQLIYWGMGATTPIKSLMNIKLFELASRIIIYPYGYVLGNRMLSDSQKKSTARTRNNLSRKK